MKNLTIFPAKQNKYEHASSWQIQIFKLEALDNETIIFYLCNENYFSGSISYILIFYSFNCQSHMFLNLIKNHRHTDSNLEHLAMKPFNCQSHISLFNKKYISMLSQNILISIYLMENTNNFRKKKNKYIWTQFHLTDT